MTQEKALELYKARLEKDRLDMATFYIASGVVLETTDRLSASPLKWIKHESKAAFKHYEKTFTKMHQKDLNNLFGLKDGDKDEGELLISTQNGAQLFYQQVGRIIGSMPVHYYPQMIEKLLTMEFLPIELINDIKAEIKEVQE